MARPVPEVDYSYSRQVFEDYEDERGSVKVSAHGGRGSAYEVIVHMRRVGGPDTPWTVDGYAYGILYKDTDYPTSREWRWAPKEDRYTQRSVIGKPLNGYPTLGVALTRIAQAVLRETVADAAKAGA